MLRDFLVHSRGRLLHVSALITEVPTSYKHLPITHTPHASQSSSTQRNMSRVQEYVFSLISFCTLMVMQPTSFLCPLSLLKFLQSIMDSLRAVISIHSTNVRMKAEWLEKAMIIPLYPLPVCFVRIKYMQIG